MNNYPELESKVRDEAEAQFDSNNQPVDGESYEITKKRRNEKTRFVRNAVDKWFVESELYSSITIRREGNSVEIRDEYFGCSITIYAPERRWEYVGGERKISIRPAYINSSTWNTGDDKTSCSDVQRNTKHYLKMVEIAVDEQNKMNQVLIEWIDFENPMRVAEWKERELTNYREREKARNEEIVAKKAAKLANK